MFGQIAGEQQQVWPVGARGQMREQGPQPLQIGLVRITRLEAEVDVGNLGDQHYGLSPGLSRRARPRTKGVG